MSFKVHGSKTRLFELATDIFTITDDLEKFDVFVTVHHWYNNKNSQLETTMTNFYS